MRRPKKHLSFGSLLRCLSDTFEALPDRRRPGSVQFNQRDILMSGFAMMFFQDPSLLQFQKRMEDRQEASNLQTLFGVERVPGDTQMRDVIDGVDPETFRPIFKEFLHRLQRGKHLEQYQVFPGLYLCAIDGSQYFGSDRVHCPGCLEKHHRNGKTSYAHQILKGAIVHPGLRTVLPLLAEEIRNTDGADKQDCETRAATRLLRKIRKDHPHLGLIIVGDGLYSKQPAIEIMQMQHMHFILVSKPGDHAFLEQHLASERTAGRTKKKEIRDEKGRRHVYEWINDVPLFGSEFAVRVNYFRYELIVTDERGEEKVTYRNSWVTDLELTDENVAHMVLCGRARWKIENECFNNLKNQGYHIEHNFGHGTRHLSFNFLLLTLVAFYFHQIFQLTDRLFQECRTKFSRREEMWNNLRSIIRMVVFPDWERLLALVTDPGGPGALRLDTS